MLRAIAHRLCSASFSISTCTSGEIVAQLTNNLPRALTSKLSPAPAKICRIALSSVTTVKITSDAAVTSDKSCAAAQPSSDASSVAAARLVS